MADSLTTKQVEHVAKLANLPVTTKETLVFQEQLSEVLEFAEKVQSAKCKKQNKRIAQESKEVTREDAADSKRCLTQEEAVSGTENKHNGMFVVPAIFES